MYKNIEKYQCFEAVRPCTSTDTSCYCTPQLKCYNVIQEIQIDNCFIDRLAGHSFEVRYTVTNYASLASSQQTSQVGAPINTGCSN